MLTYARIAGGLVAEILSIPADDVPIEDRFHPDLVADLVEIPDGTEAAEGWTWDGQAFAAPPPPPVTVPDSITRTQGLIALLGFGITEQMIRDRIALIEDGTEREIARLRFEGGSWGRGSPFIAWGAAQFALSDDQVDGLFIKAAEQ